MTRDGVDWPGKFAITDVSDLAQMLCGEIVSSAKTARQEIRLFNDHRAPALGNMVCCDLEKEYWEPYSEYVQTIKETSRIVDAVDEELHKYTCAYEVLIEKKRTLEALIEVWPEVKGWVDRHNFALYQDGCPKMDVSDAESLVRQDQQPAA